MSSYLDTTSMRYEFVYTPPPTQWVFIFVGVQMF